jgi:hypothetical protein
VLAGFQLGNLGLLMRSDPAAVEAQTEEIKARYTRLFGV